MIDLALTWKDIEAQVLFAQLSGKEWDRARLRALTLTAYAVQSAQRARLNTRFRIRTPQAQQFLERMIKVERASPATGRARVYLDGPGGDARARAILTRHEFGGVAPVPLSGRFYVGQRGAGTIARALYPRALGFEERSDANFEPYLARGRGSLGGAKRGNTLKLRAYGKGKRGTFLIRGKGIFQRQGGQVRLLWLFARRGIRVRPTLEFTATATATAQTALAQSTEQAVRDIIGWRR